MVCDDAIDFDKKGAEIAGFTCINLGFRGYQYFNKTLLPTSTLDISRITRQSFKHVRNEYELNGIFAKPTQGANEFSSLHFHPRVDYEPIVGGTTTAGQPCGALFVECVPFSSSQHSEAMDAEDKSKILDFHPIIDHTKKPAVIVEPKKVPVEAPVNIWFPWMAEIYVNGHMKGLGILLEHNWILTTSLALDGVE